MIKKYKEEGQVLSALADFIASKAGESISSQGRFTIALSGGSSPRKLYELLASDAYRRKVQWEKVFFFFGDERYVPLFHKDSNYLMAERSLFEPLGIVQDHVFAVNTALSPVDAAREYEQKIVEHFNGGACRFDFILLGLGDNSHTASLFPHTTVLHEQKSLVKEIFVEEVKMYRITFTAPLINAAHNVVFLVYGSSKAEAVHHILEDETNVDAYPAQLINPLSGELSWFLDEAAASRIHH